MASPEKQARARAEAWVARVLTGVGAGFGGLVGLLWAPQLQRRLARSLDIDPFSILPAIPIILGFALLGGYLSWKAVGQRGPR